MKNITSPQMTNNEIIDTLKGLVFGSFDRTTSKEREALNMAIEALEGQTGNWIEYGINKDSTHSICCDQCGGKIKSKGHAHSVYTANTYEYCPHCGSHMGVGDD